MGTCPHFSMQMTFLAALQDSTVTKFCKVNSRNCSEKCDAQVACISEDLVFEIFRGQTTEISGTSGEPPAFGVFPDYLQNFEISNKNYFFNGPEFRLYGKLVTTRTVTKALIGGGGGHQSYIRVSPDEFLLKSTVMTTDFRRNSSGRAQIYEYPPPPPN